MPTYSYLYSATNPQGERVDNWCEAPSIEEALRNLQRLGYTNIEFHSDAQGDALTRADPAAYKAERTPEVAKRMADAHKRGSAVLPKFAPILCFLVLGVCMVVRGGSWMLTGIIVSIIAGALAVVQFDALLPLMLYRRLIRHVEWHRYGQAMHLARRIKTLNPFFVGRVNAFELDLRIAQGLASQGHLPEALESLSKYQSSRTMEPWLYFSRVSAVYSAAEDYDGAIGCYEQALTTAPDRMAIANSAAQVVIRHRRDPVEAKRFLEMTEGCPAPGAVGKFDKWIRGMIALEEGDNAVARVFLEQAVELSIQTMYQPFATSVYSSVNAYLALALWRLGDREAARRCANIARPYLYGANIHDLSARLDAEVSAA